MIDSQVAKKDRSVAQALGPERGLGNGFHGFGYSLSPRSEPYLC